MVQGWFARRFAGGWRRNLMRSGMVTGMIVAYGYTIEWVIGWYSGNTYEWFMNVNRATGPMVQLICGLMSMEVMRYITRTDPPVAGAVRLAGAAAQRDWVPGPG